MSHGIAALAAALALPVLIVAAARRGAAADIVAATVFGTTLVLLYLASTLYHSLPPARGKQVFRVLDHGAIYLLIAGTYTPFTLGVLRGPWGWTLFGLVWGLAAAGVIFKTTGGMRYRRVSTVLYLAMGWLVVIALRPLWLLVPPWGLFWLIAGGIAYTAGVAFYAAPRLRYAHLIWHLFVMVGSTCHFVAVRWYAVA